MFILEQEGDYFIIFFLGTQKGYFAQLILINFLNPVAGLRPESFWKI